MPASEHVNKEGAPQAVRGNWLANREAETGFLTGQFHGISGDVPALDVAWVKRKAGVSPRATRHGGYPAASVREHHVPVFLPFALIHTDDHPRALSISGTVR